MPHVDKRTGQILIRIVYDGSPEAGKTTNVRCLCESLSVQRRGAVHSPETVGRRTEFFDWLDFVGGYLDGSRVRCQLVSVPGQPALLHRRRYLLASADAVVFVTGSSPDAVAESRKAFVQLQRILERVAGEAPVGVILQANKQDLPGAMSPTDVAAAIGAEAAVHAIASQADAGTGVMHTFITAVRVATERVRELLLHGSLSSNPGLEAGPEELHRELLALEALGDRMEEESAPSPHVQQPPLPVPDAREVPAGLIWPALGARSTLISIGAAPTHAAGEPRSWAPPGALEIRSAEGFLLHTSDGWRFDDQEEGRRHLLGLVRRSLEVEPLLPEGRAFFLASGDGRWRLWMISPDLSPIETSLDALVAEGSTSGLASALVELESSLATMAALGYGAPGLSAFALQHGRVRLMTPPSEGDDAPSADSADDLVGWARRTSTSSERNRAHLSEALQIVHGRSEGTTTSSLVERLTSTTLG